MRRLRDISLSSFRVFSSEVKIETDSDVVLIHGANGCGKTSLLHGIELALTGNVADLASYKESYPSCLNHWGSTSKARVTATFEEHSGEPKMSDVSVQNVGGMKTTGTLTGDSRRHFLERCYLSQSRLARLLEMYQAIDKEKKESPLASFVRNLLNLDALENLTVGLQVAGDVRRTRKDVKAFSKLEEQETAYLQKAESLRSALKTASESLKKAESESSNGVGSPKLETGLARIRNEPFTTSSQEFLDLSTNELANRENQLVQDLLELNRTANKLTEKSTVRSRDSEVIAIDEEIAERKRIAAGLGEKILDFLKETTEATSQDDDVLKSLPVSVEQLSVTRQEIEELGLRLQSKIHRIRREQEDCALHDKELAECRLAADRLTIDLRNLESQIELSVNPVNALAELIGMLQEHVIGDNCPVCDRSFAELGLGTLKDHLATKIETIKQQQSLVRTTMELRAKRDKLSAKITAFEADEEKVRSKRIVAEESLPAVLSIQKRFPDLLELHSTWLSNALKVKEANTESSKRKELQKAINEQIEKCLGVLVRYSISIVPGSSFSAESIAPLTAMIEAEIATLRAYGANRIVLKNANERVTELTLEIAKCDQESRRIASAKRKAQTILESAKLLEKLATDQKKKTIDRVFSTTMNGLWQDLFSRLVMSEQFHPYLKKPEVTRGRLATRLSAAIDGKQIFEDIAAVLSSGNLNTAALSLFLSLNLIEEPTHEVLILDDPIQNMDDIHVVNLSVLLKAIVRQANRQLIVAVHERSLFEFLKIELGPVKASESLITVELEKDMAGKSAIANCSRVVWHEDKVKFRA